MTSRVNVLQKEAMIEQEEGYIQKYWKFKYQRCKQRKLEPMRNWPNRRKGKNVFLHPTSNRKTSTTPTSYTIREWTGFTGMVARQPIQKDHMPFWLLLGPHWPAVHVECIPNILKMSNSFPVAFTMFGTFFFFFIFSIIASVSLCSIMKLDPAQVSRRTTTCFDV